MEPDKFIDKEGMFYQMFYGIRKKLRNTGFAKNLTQWSQNSSWNKLPKATLLKEINVERYSPTEIFFLKGKDTFDDFLLLKTNGIFNSNLYNLDAFGQKYSFLKNDNNNIFDLSRMDKNGKIIWSLDNGEISTDSNPYYCSHASEKTLKVDDINYDGIEEVIVLRGSELLIVDSVLGKIIKKTDLPADNFGIVEVIENRMTRDKRIVLSVMADAYEGYMYGNPTLLLDSELKIINEIHPIGSGHRLTPIDINDDGVDEFIDGYEMLDFNGERIWLLDEFEKNEYHPLTDHVDHIEVYFNNNNAYGAIAGSDYFYWVNLKNGKTLWKNKPLHAQYCLIGNFFNNSTSSSLFLTNMTHKVQLYGLDGDIKWEGTLPSNWPMGIPKNLSHKMFHMGIPANKIRIHSNDLILYNEKGWPYCINDEGITTLIFPHTKNIKKPSILLPNHRGDDFGMGFYTRVYDINNDDKDEVIIFDRRFIWIYKV